MVMIYSRHIMFYLARDTHRRYRLGVDKLLEYMPSY